MAASLTHDFVAQRFTRSGRALGPITAAKLKRTALAYAALCALGLAPTLLGLAPAWRAAGLGLWFPGAGFLASGGFSLLLIPLTAVLFGLAVFAWFGSAMMPAPIAIWLGAAALAGAFAGPEIWAPAPYVVPALTAAGGLALHRRNAAQRAAGRAARAERSVYLPRELARVASLTSTRAEEKRELTPEQLAAARYLFDRALQPIGRLDGFDRIDQFQTSALRYQLNHAGYTLAELQCHYTPSFHGYLSQAQRNLIEQYVQKPIWSYWCYETSWGHLNFTDWDPAGRDNIMLTGWFGIHVNLTMSSSGDRRYAQPGSLPFRLNARTTYAHDAHTLAASVSSNFARADYCLYPCEPNWVYPICNHYGMTSLVLHDRLFGTSDAKQHLPRWLHSLDTEFTDESGSVIGLRSEVTGLRFPFPAGDSGFALFASCWAPERARRQWAVARHDLARAIVRDASGKPRLAFPGAGFDFGNYRRGWAGTFAGILAGAREFGDEEIAEAAANALEQDGHRMEDRGVVHYAAMSNLSNIQAVSGKLRRAGDFQRAVTEGPAESALRGPVLGGARYPEVLVARAFSSGENLELVLYPGAAPGVQRLDLERLKPGASYQVRGASGERFAADANGAAQLEVALHGRTALEIELA
jgi:hypothetical protein